MKKEPDPKKRTYIISDLCMWEKNKREGTMADYAICVIDEKTGQHRFVKTGARIKFLSGEISPTLSQKDYNKK